MSAMTTPVLRRCLGNTTPPIFRDALAATFRSGCMLAQEDGTDRIGPAVASTTASILGWLPGHQTYVVAVAADRQFEVQSGIGGPFKSATAGEAVTKTEVGAICWALDDQTVGKTDAGGTLSPAGYVHAVDAEGVWVDFTHALDLATARLGGIL